MGSLRNLYSGTQTPNIRDIIREHVTMPALCSLLLEGTGIVSVCNAEGEVNRFNNLVQQLRNRGYTISKERYTRIRNKITYSVSIIGAYSNYRLDNEIEYYEDCAYYRCHVTVITSKDVKYFLDACDIEGLEIHKNLKSIVISTGVRKVVYKDKDTFTNISKLTWYTLYYN